MKYYTVIRNYKDSNGWNGEELFDSKSYEKCVKVAEEKGGWRSDEDFVYVIDENGDVVWEP